MRDSGGSVQYSELIATFERHLQHPEADKRERNQKLFTDLLFDVTSVVEEQGTKFVILRHQTFDKAKVSSDIAYGASKESLSAFVDDFQTSFNADFPEDDEDDLAKVLDWGSSNLSVEAGTEETKHENKKDDRSSCIPEVVITRVDEEWTKNTSGNSKHGQVRFHPDQIKRE
ncbi:uncharacterized protein LOC106703735 [Latimeria chalumnae]|uniref:uncharacterized protein LOC106703735 n=1 Tax=Latimeria chalumnae TaxID=7897 RepID=UPI00313EE283